MASLSGDQVRVGERTARLDVGGLAVIDEPKFPKNGPTTPARESFEVSWRATGHERTLRDDAQHFRIRGYPATVEARFTASIPGTAFTFRGRATATTYAFFGAEVNGYYFDQHADPTEAGAAAAGAAAAVPSVPPAEGVGATSGSSGGTASGSPGAHLSGSPGSGVPGVHEVGPYALGGAALLASASAATVAARRRARATMPAGAANAET